MNIPTSQPLPPEDFERLSPTRRRRRRRMIFPGASDEQAAFIEELAHRSVPSADLFLFALVSAILLGAAILADAPSFFILASLFAPFIGPVLGMALATITGTRSFFFQSLGGLILAFLIYFLIGIGSGWAASIWWKDLPVIPTQVYFHNSFTWPDMAVLALGAVLTAFFLVRDNSQKPLLSSAALAYEILLPVGVAGFGLTSGVPGLFPNAIIISLTNLLVAVLLCVFTMAIMGLRPRDSWGFTIGTTLCLLVIILFMGLNSIGQNSFKPKPSPLAVNLVKDQVSATATPTIVNSATLTPSAVFTLQKSKAAEPTGLFTPTNTLMPTRTQIPTSAVEPTPIYAKINVKGGAGALVRERPDGSSPVVKSALNETLVQILPESNITSGQLWIKVRLSPDGAEGWILRSSVITATPVN